MEPVGDAPISPPDDLSRASALADQRRRRYRRSGTASLAHEVVPDDRLPEDWQNFDQGPAGHRDRVSCGPLRFVLIRTLARDLARTLMLVIRALVAIG